jgi:hypothetical protein
MAGTEFTIPTIFGIGMLILMIKSFTDFPATATICNELVSEPVHPAPATPCTLLRSTGSLDPAGSPNRFSQASQGLAKYHDIEAAIADGYRFPLGAAGQKLIQLTNHWFAFKAAFGFDAEHPTSLLYEKTQQGSYLLVGAVFTAPARFGAEELEARIPSSVAQWHRHDLFGWAAEVHFADAQSFHAA